MSKTDDAAVAGAAPRKPHPVKSAWYVLAIVPQMARLHDPEKRVLIYVPRVLQRLRQLGVGVYSPSVRSERQHRRTKAWLTVVRPLLPGYLFIELLDARSWPYVLGCEDVIDVLRDGEQPFPIMPRLVETMMAGEQQMLWDNTREAKLRRHEIGRTQRETVEMRFPVGSEIRVADGGPFHGFAGVVSGVTSRCRLEARIEIFGRLTPCELDPGQVERLAA